MNRLQTAVEEYGALWQMAATQLGSELGASPDRLSSYRVEPESVRSVADIINPIVRSLAVVVDRDEAELGPKLHRRFVRVLSSRPWRTVEVSVPWQSHEADLVSRLTPANREFAELVGESYFLRYNLTGRPSEALKLQCASEPLRPANLWFSELVGPNGKHLFAGFRSGTFSFYGEVDKKRRETANQRMAGELLVAAVAAARKVGLINGGGIKLLSIDLQSPNSTRENLAIERQTTAEHRAALLSLRRQSYDGVGVERLLTFNLPSHHAEFQFGYAHDKQRNGAALYTLVKEAMLSDSESTRKLAVAVREMWQSERYTTGEAPYQLQAMVALLGFQLGYVVHFNCRSGKDRTGMLDGEIKLLAMQLNSGSDSWLSSALAEPERAALQQLLLQGGGVEVQLLNTGVPGSKLRPITKGENDPLVSRLGSAWKEFKGYSHLTGM